MSTTQNNNIISLVDHSDDESLPEPSGLVLPKGATSTDKTTAAAKQVSPFKPSHHSSSSSSPSVAARSQPPQTFDSLHEAAATSAGLKIISHQEMNSIVASPSYTGYIPNMYLGPSRQSYSKNTTTRRTAAKATTAHKKKTTNKRKQQQQQKKKKPQKFYTVLKIVASGKGQSRNWRQRDVQIMGVYNSKNDAMNAKDAIVRQFHGGNSKYGKDTIVDGGDWDDVYDIIVRESPIMFSIGETTTTEE